MENTKDFDVGISSADDERLTSEQTYDSALTTMIARLDKYVIPLINELFGTKYSRKTKVVFQNRKHVIRDLDGSLKKRETDAYMELAEENGATDGEISRKAKYYHIECETWYDNSIVLRIAEYSSVLAIENAESTKEGVTLNYPDSAVIFLQPGRRIPDSMRITHRAPDGFEISYQVPALQISSYDLDAIFEKKLLILLPFYLFRYTREFAQMENDADKRKELDDVLAEISQRLDSLTKDSEITAYQQRTILRLLLRVSDKLTAKYENIRKEVDDTMRGYVLRTDADDIWDSGMEKGRQEERKEMSGLMNFLLMNDRNADAIRATTDKTFLEELLAQFRQGTLAPGK